MNEAYIEQLVAEWSDVYKKGQLSFWILLSVVDGHKYSSQIAEFMTEVSGGMFEVKEQSLYRALRRFEAMKLVKSTEKKALRSGSKRKYYYLTDIGRAVLDRFIRIHINPLYASNVKQLINATQVGGVK